MDNDIDFDGLTPAEALHALYHGTRPPACRPWHDKPDFTVADAEAWIKGERSIIRLDYVWGRPIKVDIDCLLKVIRRGATYDRDAGQGQAARVIAAALARKARK